MHSGKKLIENTGAEFRVLDLLKSKSNFDKSPAGEFLTTIVTSYKF